ncbi:zinc finger protein 184 [Dendroctonus ponderosae]|uniref:zinc finger protein 184 n=1 Tax=Dendroctonus ponderosae TaxID=77166 RepID=UPI0020365077|nr:zinc finger protein 184 [Dendroctonus ponderosae]
MDLKGDKTDYGQICRICLKSSACLNNLFEADVPHMLKFCGFLEVNDNDDLLRKICPFCHNLLIQSYQLKQLCISSQLYFESLKEQHETLTINALNTGNTGNESEIEYTDLEDTLLKDADCLLVQHIINISLEQNLTREVDGEYEHEITEKSDLSHLNCEEIILPQSPDNDSKKEYSQCTFLCHICKIKFEHKQDVAVHQSIHDNLNTCNVCKKVFSSVQLLKRHIKTHMMVKSHKCRICSKSFVESYDVRKHTKRHHLGIPVEKKYICHKCGQRKIFVCTLCATKFTKSCNLSRHMKNKHGFTTRKDKATLKCPLCENKRTTYKELEAHLTSQHHLDITYSELNFASKESFEQWKTDIEKKTLSFFQCRRTDGNFVQYVCHRSGQYVPKPKTSIRQRAIKAQESNKIGACCPARIEIKKKDGCGIEGLFVSTHVGHQQEVGRLRLTKAEKEVLAGKLLRGVPNQQILKELRNSFDPNLKLSYITNNDLHNLKKALNIRAGVIFHGDDAKECGDAKELDRNGSTFIIKEK